MKKNDGWKRASCVLLAAQMTVSSLPMSSMAAYIDGSGSRSAAILKAADKTANDQMVAKASFFPGVGWPLMSKRRINHNSRSVIAPIASVLEVAPPADGIEDIDALYSENVTTTIEGSMVLPVDLAEPGIVLPSVDSIESTEETDPVDPAEPDKGTEPVDPVEPGEETEPVDPAEPGEGTEPADPAGPSEGTNPVDPAEPGEVTEPVDPVEPGEGIDPVDPAEPGEGTDLVDPAEPGEGTEPVDPTEPDEGIDALDPMAPLEVEGILDQANLYSLEDDWAGYLAVNVNLNLYGYDGWAAYAGRRNRVIKDLGYGETWADEGVEIWAPPYQIEGETGGMDQYGRLLQNADYLAYYWPEFDGYPAEEGVSDAAQALGDLKLGRIPDMRQEGWVFAQSSPDPEKIEASKGSLWGQQEKILERAWVVRYDSSQPSDPYMPDFSTLMEHNDPTLANDDGMGTMTFVTNVVAKWVPSSRADLTSLQLYGWEEGKSDETAKTSLELYGEDFTQEGKEKHNQQPVSLETYQDGKSFNSDQEYYVQVPVTTDRLTMDFTSYEPGTMIKIERQGMEPILYRYDRQDYVWLCPTGVDTVSAEEYAARNRALEGSTPLVREQPGRRTGGLDALYGDPEGKPTNSAGDPARAEWALLEAAAIPLDFTDPDQVYTDITITVVAPDGTMSESGATSGTTATYTLHVRRMVDPKMTLNPGNTPYGVIDSDNSPNVGTSEEKQILKDMFDNDRRLPHGLYEHNGGATYTGVFNSNAWADVDYDKESTALVVYQDSAFEDPGFSLVDSQGKEADSTGLHRSIKLKLATQLTTDVIQNGAGGGIDHPLEIDVTTAEGKDRIDLTGQYVIPGIYTMEYSYYDSASDETYDSTDLTVYRDPAMAVNFSRPLIVLPKPGDVDMDGLVTLADGLALENLLNDPNSFLHGDSNNPIQRLFKYRVCDVDGDGEVTSTDVDNLKTKYVASQTKGSFTNFFYLNSVDNDEQGREPLTTETTGTGKAELSIEYLGKNFDTVPTAVNKTVEVELGDTLWVGVKLTNASALGEAANNLQGFEFTLVYDKELLEPGLLKDHTDWKSTIQELNLSTAGTTLWGDAYTLLIGSGPAGSLMPHSELAVSTLRSGKESELGSYTFALQLKAGRTAVSLQDGYILYVPFKLIKHPAGVSHDKVAMIEPAMGGRELSTVTTGNAVNAWSSREDVFGGVTGNLKTVLAYVGSDKIPVGEDKTARIRLYDDNTQGNAQYGAAFTTSGVYTNDKGGLSMDLSNAVIDVNSLPPGMVYDPTGLGRIYTNDPTLGATKAGAYQFYVDGVLCEIVVDKAPLTLTVDIASRYYGEENPASAEIPFKYERGDLKAPDRIRAIAGGFATTGSGDENELKAILADDNYVRPTVTTVDANGAVLTKKAPVSEEYVARLTGGESTNYKFRYLRRGETASNDVEATNYFRVIQRPIKVGIPTGPVGQIGSKVETGKHIIPVSMTLANGDGVSDSLVGWPDNRTSDGMMNGLSLKGTPIVAGDSVTLTARGEFCPIEGKDISSDEYVLDEGNLSEPRDVLLRYVALDGEQKNNYRIDVSSPITAEGAKTTGTVVQEPIVKLELTNKGQMEKDHTYGDFFSPAYVSNVVLTWKSGYSEPIVWGPSLNPRGISMAWVDSEGALPSTGVPAVNGEDYQVKKHNNKWLCVYVQNAGDVPPACDWVGPFTVKKADLTLTVAGEKRYYGESDAAPKITYSKDDLKTRDKVHYINGQAEELVGKLEGFTYPQVTRSQTASVDGTTVNNKTDAGDYFVVISQSISDNYNIVYTQSNKATPSKEFGYAPLKVDRRPVRVEQITGRIGYLYDDAVKEKLTVEGIAAKPEDQNFEFEMAIPTADYYPAGGSDPLVTLGKLSGTAILPGDSLKLTFQATFETDRAQAPFFDLSTFPANSDTKLYDVTVDRLQLDTSYGAGRNYQLVYNSSEKAFYGYPEDTQVVDDGGEVSIRRIERLEISQIPDFMGDYTYGDGLLVAGKLGVRIYYSRGGSKDILYSKAEFTENGLTLEWADENGAVVPGGGETAYEGQIVTASDHNGRHLVVRGRRAANHEEKTVVVQVPITVKKKKITIRAEDITRVYGEENMGPSGLTYQGLVDWSGKDALIPQDKQWLIDHGYTDFNDSTHGNPNDDVSIRTMTLGQPAESKALSALDPTYKGPEFRTPANVDSPAGTYPLYLSGGEMANYEFECAPGQVIVRKRVIQLEEINPSKEYLATMVVGSPIMVMDNVTATRSPTVQDLTFANARKDMLAQNGAPVRTGDTVSVSMTVTFGFDSAGNPKIPTLPAGAVTDKTWVKISDVKLVGDAIQNYELADNLYHGRQPVEKGRLDGRTIDHIELSASAAPKLNYVYGEALDLSGVLVDIYYKSASGETEVIVEKNAAINRSGLSLHYLPDPSLVNNAANNEQIAEGKLGPQAFHGDHLTIATDMTGFAHQGKYLAISVKEKDPNNPGGYLYPKPLLVNTNPIQISKKQLIYTVQANEKPYDGTLVGSGSAWVEINQIYEDDVVYLHTGKRYDNMEMPQEGGSYRFDSGLYGTGLTFTFKDPNVAYEQTPAHDQYGALKAVPVAVSGVTLMGKDAGNYTIINSIADSDPAAPQAIITRAVRPAPAIADQITMSTDIHTNTVTVTVDGSAPTYGDKNDPYNDSELHFEYALEYLVNENDPAPAFIAIEGGDSRFFGGEKVEYTGDEFEAGDQEKDELTPGMGQKPVAGDMDFGVRAELPRDTYFRAKVRLAQTRNYEASEYTPSVSNADMVAAVAAARAAEESDDLGSTSNNPEEIKPPRPIPDRQALGKTYQYRFDIITAQTMRDTEGKERVRSQLDSVWFADRATYPTENYFSALTTDAVTPRYHDYSWDPLRTRGVIFPLDMRKEITANLLQEDGSYKNVVVNENNTARVYASMTPNKGGGTYYIIDILNDDVVAYLGDAPVQLNVRIIPDISTSVVWRSSDPSVVAVDSNGLLTFVGVGVAEIYASIALGGSDSIHIIVLPPELDGLLNVDYLEAFMELTDDLMFYPERTMTRGELAVVLARLVYPTLADVEGEAPDYVDIREEMDCAQAVELLSRLGILTGVGENHYAPEQMATRAEMAAILVRLGQLSPAAEGAWSFVDSSPEDTWAWAEIESLRQSGITDGTGDNCFSPDRLLTRAETAAFLTRMLRYELDLGQDGLRHPVDVKNSYWAWKEIMRAVNGGEELKFTERPLVYRDRSTRKFM